MTRLSANHPAVRAALRADGDLSASDLERAMQTVIIALGIPAPKQQHPFDARRGWQFDFAWPDQHIAVEVHGGIWTGGRHVRGQGFTNDRQKMNAAVLAGWRVLEFTGDMIASGEAAATLSGLFARPGAPAPPAP